MTESEWSRVRRGLAPRPRGKLKSARPPSDGTTAAQAAGAGAFSLLMTAGLAMAVLFFGLCGLFILPVLAVGGIASLAREQPPGGRP